MINSMISFVKMRICDERDPLHMTNIIALIVSGHATRQTHFMNSKTTLYYVISSNMIKTCNYIVCLIREKIFNM